MAATQLVWLRNDLRLNDHPAIYEAQQQGDIAIVICMTPEQWQEHNESPAKCALREQLVNALYSDAKTLNISVHILHLHRFSDCAAAITALCTQHKYQQVWWQNELPVHESQRDAKVENALSDSGIASQRMAPDLIVATPVLNQQNAPFKVFTPFYKRWLQVLTHQLSSPYPEPNQQSEPSQTNHSAFANKSFREDLWPADYTSIREKLWRFCHKKEAQYEEDRDFPALPGTSLLSPYLALGAVGPRSCLEAILYVSQKENRDWKSSVWLKELAWRDFYKQLMGHFPDLSKSLPFKPETQNVKWNDDEFLFQAWCEGNTGFPIVDAAMRQLNQTGWMHNRLRMIAASFLTKLLLIDWRKGEAYFMAKLIDGEFAANNGGWQWSASTGCDAAPYFRVFNPTRQSERFDPNGEFIKRFVPELAPLPPKEIHAPTPAARTKLKYNAPIIDYKSARKRAIAAFEDLK